MDAFAAAGWRSTSKRKPYGNRDYMATNAQIGCIRKLWGEYIGEPGSEAGLATWLERKWGVSSLRFVTLEQAPGLIAALRKMVARRRRERGDEAPAPAA